MLEQYHVILASNSPRRKELLSGLDIPFEIKTIKGLEESYPETLQGGDIPLFLAKQKAQAYDSELKGNVMIITADTIVWHNDEVMGKPKSREEAIEMLKKLSGDTHQVFTGVCVKTVEKEVSFVASSDVKFAPLSEEEIIYYIDKYKPFDKAGSYGVQEWIGYVGISAIEGSYFNVMGFPVHRVWEELQSFI